MDNQRLKNFLTENTRRTAVLRIPGFIIILLSVILAFMPGFIFFYISIATLIAGVIYILIVNSTVVKKTYAEEYVNLVFAEEQSEIENLINSEYEKCSGPAKTVFSKIVSAQCILGDGIVFRKVRDNAFVSSFAAICGLAVDKKSEKIYAYIIEYDFIKDTRIEKTLSVSFENVTAIRSSRTSYSENGISFKPIEVEIASAERTINLFFRDDYETNQLMEYLTRKIK